MKNNLNQIQRKLLITAFLKSIPNLDMSNNDIDKYLEMIPKEVLERERQRLIALGYLKKDGLITDDGRKQIRVGVIGGVFDVLHIGHIHMLRKAKEQVDVLIVIIATDDTVKKMKNREPLHKQEWRKDVITSLKYVDAAIIGEEKEFRVPLIKINPDVIFLGYDQKIPPGISKKELQNREVIKLNFKIEGVKTSKILEKLESL